MKQIIINLENPEILSLEKTGNKDAITKVKTALIHQRFQSTSGYLPVIYFPFLLVSSRLGERVLKSKMHLNCYESICDIDDIYIHFPGIKGKCSSSNN
jgi:hypothetical protein